MAEITRFMNSYGNDKRIYDAQDFSFIMQQLIGSPFDESRVGTGVSRYYPGYSSDELLKVSANGQNMVTTVTPGAAAIFGHFYELTEPKQLFHQAANSNLLRVDRVVLRLDNRIDQRKITVEIKIGTPSNNRLVPDLTWTDEIKEIALASVDIIAGRSYITQTEVLDTRTYKEVAGYMPLHNIFRGLQVDSNGISSQPKNSYVRIEGNLNQNIPDRTPTTLNVSSRVVEDRQNEMRENRYLAKTTGVYQITCYISFDEGYLPSGTDVQLQIFKNGTYNTMIIARSSVQGNDNIFNGSEIIDLTEGDSIEITAYIIGSVSNYTMRGFRCRIAKMF